MSISKMSDDLVEPLPCALTILMLDQDAAHCAAVQTYLIECGHQVTAVTSLADALAAFLARKPDLLLLDANVPAAEQQALLSRAHSWTQGCLTTVWLLATETGVNAQVTALLQGADDYLLKPLNLALLAAKLVVLQRSLAERQRLEEESQRAHAIANRLIDGVIVIDTEGLILDVNAAALRIFSYSLDELLGRNISLLMPEPYASAHDGYLQRYLLTGQAHILGVCERETQGKRKNGEVFPLELGVTELHTRENRSFIGVVRDISERKHAQQLLLDKSACLQRYRDEQEDEQRLACDILARVMRHDGLSDARLQHWVWPAEKFSGDIVAGVRSTHGKLYALLADATGHGLGAAISVLPVMTCLQNMAEYGFPLSRIVSRLNAQLRNILPSSRFVAAALVCIDESAGTAEIWNGGMPDVLLLGPEGDVEQRFPSRHLALGVVDFNRFVDAECVATELVSWRNGSQFVLYSDGILEAANSGGEAFGTERLIEALTESAGVPRLTNIMFKLKEYVEPNQPHDDVSLMLVECVESSCAI